MAAPSCCLDRRFWSLFARLDARLPCSARPHQHQHQGVQPAAIAGERHQAPFAAGFSMPRSRNCRIFIPCFIMPSTGSTVCFRFLYLFFSASLWTAVFMIFDPLRLDLLRLFRFYRWSRTQILRSSVIVATGSNEHLYTFALQRRDGVAVGISGIGQYCFRHAYRLRNCGNRRHQLIRIARTLTLTPRISCVPSASTAACALYDWRYSERLLLRMNLLSGSVRLLCSCGSGV